jgi:hypothetical protein
MSKILILGGYGNFGRRIAMALAKSDCHIVIAGRHLQKAKQCADAIRTRIPKAPIETADIDINKQLSEQLTRIRPKVVINTCGPFQRRDYTVAQCCLAHRVHYIDLADARDYVTGITALDQDAKAAAVLVISGASTVPALSSAVLEYYRAQFSKIDSLRYGISPGQQVDLGLATAKSLLSYVGKPLKPFAGHSTPFGWQHTYRQRFPDIGKRWMSSCDVPDLDLLPSRYGIKTIQFSAGMELPIVHWSLWVLGWIIRLGLPLDLPKYAPLLLRLNRWLKGLGTPDGGMHISIQGKDHQDTPKRVEWFIIAKNGDGPHIPTIPAVVLAKKLVTESLTIRGAMPCVGLVTLSEYRDALTAFDINVFQP